MSEPLNNTGYDNDMDTFLNFDQTEPMSSSADLKSVTSFHDQNNDFGSNASVFSAPSYQYDAHRQQTGIVGGAYQNTLAINNAQGLHWRPGNSFITPTQTLNMPLTNLDDYDFSKSLGGADMDFETDSPADVPSMFYDGEAGSSISPAAPIPPRIYPGVHTQQANQAKLNQAQKQQEMMSKPRQLPAGQQPLPTTVPKMEMPSPAQMNKDPHVEESISRLLNRMRQSSSASAGGDADDADSPDALPRFKKDEDDMDEDERLLNSEEGKKLSSKERRQLRNKVSARAFRSRRKEYITQLEAEVAGKAQEANELRIQNRQLMEENTRLTDLTRMLLSSNAFSGFLQELSNSGVPNKALGQAQGQQQQQPTTRPQAQQQRQTQPMRKDVSAHDAALQLQHQHSNSHMQVGMTLIPETPIDMSVFDGHNSWNSSMVANDYQVFAVTELPEPPKLDMSALTGKTDCTKSTKSNTKEYPVLPEMPLLNGQEQSNDLYEESTTVSYELPTDLSFRLSKASLYSSLRLSIPGTANQLQELCKDLDEQCEKISRLM